MLSGIIATASNQKDRPDEAKEKGQLKWKEPNLIHARFNTSWHKGDISIIRKRVTHLLLECEPMVETVNGNTQCAESKAEGGPIHSKTCYGTKLGADSPVCTRQSAA